MSRASRLAAADTRIEKPRHPTSGRFVSRWDMIGPQLGLNRSRVPGGLGFELEKAVVAAGIVWLPEHGWPSESPIGTALAAEIASTS